MAETDPKSKKAEARKRKEPETIRQKADKETEKRIKPTKKSRLKSKVSKPLSTLHKAATKEYHPIKVPEKKGIKHLNKKVHIIPKFLKNAWAELKLVTWPTKKEAMKLTFAVIAFSIVFAVFVQALDYIFSRVVKEIILR